MTKPKTGVAKRGAGAKTVDKLAPATETAASGALIEPTIVGRIDTTHASVDDTPRERSTSDMNRIDFNTPSGVQSPEETVVEKLSEQGDA